MLLGTKEYSNRSVRNVRLNFPENFQELSDLSSLYFYLEKETVRDIEFPYLLASPTEIPEISAKSVKLPIIHSKAYNMNQNYIRFTGEIRDHLYSPQSVTFLGIGGFFEIWASRNYNIYREITEEYTATHFESIELHLL